MNPLAELRLAERIGVVLAGRFERGLDFLPGVEVRFGTDSAAATFQRRTTGPWLFNRVLSLPPPGSCAVYQFRGKAFDQQSTPALLAANPTLDAGDALSMSSGGQSYASVPLLPNELLYLGQSRVHLRLTALDTDVFGGGAEVRATVPGGADVGASAFAFRPPPRIEWLNQSELASIDRSQNLTMRWTATNGATVALVGAASDVARDASAAFLCTARADDGSFAVPAHVLSSLPRTPAGAPVGTTALLGIAALPQEADRFQASGIDLGLAAFVAASAREVRFR
jgi:hypothetical protein